jgi:protein-S-isoprenylcysteine O-methyltransferase Ste14
LIERVFVWLGGALFVVSLAATAFTYFVRWARPASGSEPLTAVGIDLALVSIFALHHTLFAREATKRALGALVPARLLRSVYVWVASLLLLGVLGAWRAVPGVVYHITGWPAALNGAVQVVGVWLIALAVAKISALELAGIRPPRQDEVLQVTGPYAWVRHPLYLGWMLALFAAATMTGDRLTFAVLTSSYLVVAVPFEEHSLERTFGAQYAAYRKSVRWRIIPFVY